MLMFSILLDLIFSELLPPPSSIAVACETNIYESFKVLALLSASDGHWCLFWLLHTIRIATFHISLRFNISSATHCSNPPSQTVRKARFLH